MAEPTVAEEEGSLTGRRLVSIILVLCNSWMNPIIYGALNTNLRNEMKLFLLKCKYRRQVVPSGDINSCRLQHT